jgi:hypothetical protein
MIGQFSILMKRPHINPVQKVWPHTYMPDVSGWCAAPTVNHHRG